MVNLEPQNKADLTAIRGDWRIIMTNFIINGYPVVGYSSNLAPTGDNFTVRVDGNCYPTVGSYYFDKYGNTVIVLDSPFDVCTNWGQLKDIAQDVFGDKVADNIYADFVGV